MSDTLSRHLFRSHELYNNLLQNSRSNRESGGHSSGISLSGSKEFSTGFLKSAVSSGHPGETRGAKYSATGSSSNVSSPLGSGANNGVPSVVYSMSQQHLSHKRSLNSLELKGKKGIMIGELFYFNDSLSCEIILIVQNLGKSNY